VVVPADHYYANDALFVSAVESAFLTVEYYRDSIVLLGAEAEYPEVEYGWIERGASVYSLFADCGRVNRFWEKPSPQVAKRLFTEGCLWNTFVMIGRVATFLECIESGAPDLWRAFQKTNLRMEEEDFRAFEGIPSIDFSHQILSGCTERLLVLSLGQAGWSDFGKAERVLATLARAGVTAEWATSPAFRPLYDQAVA
jgi:mannose-1-phosphate guanylyltransferase